MRKTTICDGCNMTNTQHKEKYNIRLKVFTTEEEEKILCVICAMKELRKRKK